MNTSEPTYSKEPRTPATCSRADVRVASGILSSFQMAIRVNGTCKIYVHTGDALPYTFPSPQGCETWFHVEISHSMTSSCVNFSISTSCILFRYSKSVIRATTATFLRSLGQSFGVSTSDLRSFCQRVSFCIYFSLHCFDSPD